MATETAPPTVETSDWWWNYATEKVPSHSEMYYFKFTLVVILFYQCCQIVTHLVASRYSQVYRDKSSRDKTMYRLYV